MAKNIIVCSDGTGNTAIKGRGTNVFKIFEAVDLNSHRYRPERKAQVAIYDDGVGTESFKPLKLLGGVFGVGLSRNVRQLYKELCRIYDVGDHIYLFGFSRGAFTARTLVGLISACGILKTSQLKDSGQLEQLVAAAYKTYRRRYRTKLVKTFFKPDLSELDRFKAEHSHGGEKIELIGVWDTVDAVGLPFPAFASFINSTIYQFKFPSRTLSPIVKRAYHALAIDDARHSFHPLLWQEPKPAQKDQTIEQVWFSGAHSNVGGGYPKQGMSLVALDWMMTHAKAAGLRFIDGDSDYYQAHANVDDKLYDPRSGPGIAYRWLPRDIAQLCEGNCEPKIHMSVLERAAHGTEDYSPGNLPAQPSVVFTPTGNATKDAVAADRATKLQRELTTGRVLLREVSNTVAIGRRSYELFMLALLTFVPCLISFGLVRALLLSGISSALAFVAAHGAKSSRQRHFSTFWLEKQRDLREALKSTRSTPLSENALEFIRRQPDNDASPEPADQQRKTKP